VSDDTSTIIQLIDLARRYYGPRGLGANHSSQAEHAGSSDQEELMVAQSQT
jgi:hypothetical protein